MPPARSSASPISSSTPSRTSCDARDAGLRLARQPMDLLLLLLERPRELVSREEIANPALGTGRLRRSRCGDSHGRAQDPTGAWVNRASHHGSWRPFRARAIGSSRQSSACLSIATAAVLRRCQPQPIRLPETFVDTICRPSSRASSAGGRSSLELRRLLDGIAPAVADRCRGRRENATGRAPRFQSSCDEVPEGMWLIELAPLTTPDLIAQTIATLSASARARQPIGARGAGRVSAASRSAARSSIPVNI